MTPATPSARRQSWTLLATLTTGHMVNDFNALILPFLLPTLIEVFSLDFFQAGILSFATTFMPAFLNPTMGYWADKYGKRKLVLLVGFVSVTLALTVASLAPNYLLLFIAFLILGVGQSTFHAQSTNYLTHTFGSSKGRALGIHGLGGSVGNFMVPVLVTQLLVWFTWQSTTLMLAIPSVVVIVLFIFTLPELDIAPRNITLLQVRLDRHLWVLALCIGFMSMMYRSVLTFLPTYLVEIGYPLRQAGLISTLMLFIGFLAQPLGGFAFDKVGGRVQYALCAIIAGASLLLFTTVNGGWVIFFVVTFGAAVVALFPVSLAMSGELARGDMVGLKTGFVFGISALMSSITPPLTGFLADRMGLESSLQWLALFSVALFVAALFLPGRRQTT